MAMINGEYDDEDDLFIDEDPDEEDEFTLDDEDLDDDYLTEDDEDTLDELETDEDDDIADEENDDRQEDADEEQVNIEDLDTMDIPFSGFSPTERAAEYRRRGQSPSGVIDGVYNDTQLPPGVAYNDCNRDWDAGA